MLLRYCYLTCCHRLFKLLIIWAGILLNFEDNIFLRRVGYKNLRLQFFFNFFLSRPIFPISFSFSSFPFFFLGMSPNSSPFNFFSCLVLPLPLENKKESVPLKNLASFYFFPSFFFFSSPSLSLSCHFSFSRLDHHKRAQPVSALRPHTTPRGSPLVETLD